jgi:hypothetical protein
VLKKHQQVCNQLTQEGQEERANKVELRNATSSPVDTCSPSNPGASCPDLRPTQGSASSTCTCSCVLGSCWP